MAISGGQPGEDAADDDEVEEGAAAAWLTALPEPLQRPEGALHEGAEEVLRRRERPGDVR